MQLLRASYKRRKFTIYQPTNLYTKLKAPAIFNGQHFEKENVVLILKEGTVDSLVPAEDAGDDVQHVEGILCPGFINAHCHSELSHLKNKIPKHTGLVPFLQQVLQYRNETATEAVISNALDEMYNSGTVAVGDICNTSNSISAKLKSPIHFKNFIEVSGFVEAFADQRFAAIQHVKKEFELNGLQATIVPHAPYSVSPALMRLVSEASEGELISIHNQECEAENKFFQNGEGEMFELYKNMGIDISFFKLSSSTSFQTWRPYFLDNKIISVHNTFISKEDIQSSSDVSFCVCINANLYIENTLPPLQMLLDEGAHIILGTDSRASNESLNLCEEIKTILQHFPQISLETILRWATSNGASALQIDHTYGSFKKGLRPGVVQIHENISRKII